MNALFAALLAVLFFVKVRRRADLPVPRSRLVAALLPAAVALASTVSSLRLPYLSDDFAHLFLSEAPTPFALFGRTPGSIFYRPVAWSVWWVIGRLAPDDPFAARVLCVALFAAGAALVPLALRRCGVPRGAALGAAILYAASPIAVETASWSSNLYGLLSVGFAVSAVAALPVRRLTPARLVAPTLLAGLAYLSREDAFPLPILLGLAGAHFRLRRWRDGVKAALAALVLLALAVGLRFELIGGFGGYGDPSTSSLAPGRWMRSVLRIATEESFAGMILPLRDAGATVAALLAALPLVLLALGAGSAVLRRSLPRALAWAGLGILPLIPVLRMGDDLVGARSFLMALPGLVLLPAAAVASLPAPGAAKWGALGSLTLLSLAFGRVSASAWDEAAAAFRKGMASVTPRVAALPPGGRIVVYGLPDTVRGIPCFRTAVPVAFMHATRRRDIDVQLPATGLGRFSSLLEYDPKTGELRDATEVDAGHALARGESWPADLGAIRRFGVSASLAGEALDASVVLPAVRLPEGASCRIEVDGLLKRGPGDEGPPLLVATFAGPSMIRRAAVSPHEKLTLPPGTTWLRLDLWMLPTWRLRLDGVRFTVED